jgi:hypothetical protein
MLGRNTHWVSAGPARRLMLGDSQQRRKSFVR